MSKKDNTNNKASLIRKQNENILREKECIVIIYKKIKNMDIRAVLKYSLNYFKLGTVIFFNSVPEPITISVASRTW